MAEAGRNRFWWLVLAALYLCARPIASAQPDFAAPRALRAIQVQTPRSGSLTGRLTDLHSSPLGGVSIVLRNCTTGTEIRTTTARNGAFHFASLDAGEYTLEADAIQLGHGRLDGIVVAGGIESHVQAAMQFAPAKPAMLQAFAPSQSTAKPPSSKPSVERIVPLIKSRPALNTTNPELVATIAAEPLQSMSAAILSAGNLIRPLAPPSKPNQVAPPASAQPAAAAEKPMQAPTTKPSQPTPPVPTAPGRIQPSIEIPARSQLPALQTEFAPTQLALAVIPIRPFPLKPAASPSFAGPPTTAALQAALLHLSAVTPGAPTTQSTDPVAAAIDTTVTAAQLQALPANGRRWQEFLLDAPTASSSTNSSNISLQGSQEPEDTAVDGASTRLAFGTAAGANSRASESGNSDNSQSNSANRSWSGGRGLGVSEAAIHEVTISAGNVETDAMGSARGRTAVQTESGTNVLHGQGFLFDRQNTWGARNPFTQWVRNTGSATAPAFTAAPFTPPDHEIVWGLGAGGVIRRDKLFWFAAFDSSHRNDPGVSTVRNPAEFFTMPEPTSASVTLLSAQLGESQNQAYSDYLGVASSGYVPAGLEQLAALLGPAQRNSTQWTGFGRVDWQAAERHHFTFEGTGTVLDSPGGGLTRVSETYGTHSYGSRYASQQRLLARWEAYLSPNLLLVTQVSAGRAILSARPGAPSTFEQSLLGVNNWNQLPQIIVDSRYGLTIGNPSRFGQGSYPDERLYHVQQTLGWAHDQLVVRAGFEIDHNADAVTELRNQTGTYSYSTVASFISDALAFQKFGLGGALDPRNPHNCGSTNTKWGSQPCYSWFSQTMGPSNWHLSTNDWGGFETAQWQLNRLAVFSVGLRLEHEQMPPPIASLANPELSAATQANPVPALPAHLPGLGINWGPRFSFSVGEIRNHWPVLRLGYGIYYGRTQNATIESALTQTGSLKGDLSFFLRPSDDCQFCAGGAPPFPYVPAGAPSRLVVPGAVGFASRFRTPEVHQAIGSLEQSLPGRLELSAGAMLSLGRRLPISTDTNFNSAVNPGTITYSVKDPTGTGPIKAPQITVPFYATWPFADCPAGAPMNPGSQCGRRFGDYQQITQVASRANSTYEAAFIRIARYGSHGLSLHANYTYAHAADWNPNETALVAGSDALDPANFALEYGTGNLDIRHSASIMAIYNTPWKLRGLAGRMANGWMLSGIGHFRSGLPYTMRTSGSLPEKFDTGGGVIAAIGPGMNGSGGDNRVYGIGSDGRSYNVGRNTFRYPDTWKADFRLARRFNFGERREVDLIAESFNLFNHQNVTRIETTGYAIENSGSSSAFPTLCYLTINTLGYASCGTSTITGSGLPIAAFGRSIDINATDFYRERQIEFGARVRF
jgi:hypothetical protein